MPCLQVMIKRDRNHPSIVIWSICNENLGLSYRMWWFDSDIYMSKALEQLRYRYIIIIIIIIITIIIIVITIIMRQDIGQTLIQSFAGPKLRRLCDTSNPWTDARRLKALAHRLDPDMGRLVSESRIKRCRCLPMIEPFDLQSAESRLHTFLERWHPRQITIHSMGMRRLWI